LEKVLRIILALLIVCNFLSLLVIFISHLSFPFPLEWAEEGVLHHCIQIIQGNQIYAEPSAAFVAFPYTPLYYYLGALLMKLLGEGFLALRIISMLSFLGSLVLVYRIISNETRNRLASWIGCGLFAASFGVVGYWYDVGRIDSLAIFLILFSGYILRYYPGTGGAVLSAILFSASFLTKQSAFVFLPFMVIPICLSRRRDALIFSITSVVVCAGFLMFLSAESQGWSWFYLFKIPASTPRLYRVLLGYPIKDLLANFPFLLAAMLFFLWGADHHRAKKEVKALLGNFWIWFFLAGFLVSYLSRLKYGGWDNVLYSVVAVLPLPFGILLGRFLSSDETGGRRKLVLVLIVLQFLPLIYDPSLLIPKEADYRGGEIFIERVSEIPGEVLVFYHSHLDYMAKGKTSAHAAALKELPNVYDAGVPFKGMPKDLYEAVTKRRYSAIILDDRAETEVGNPWTKFISKYYSFSEEIYKPGEPRLRFMTGAQSIPRFVYRPRVGEIEEI
ncbi:MAG: ArnT family glycosyltransferase, partial [Candidatus Zixiibacteriota bacterium]